MAEARKIDLDRLARDAMAEGKTGSIRIDLVKELEDCVANWLIAIEPISPRTKSDGGILLPPVSVEAQQYAITCGRVVALGPTALSGKTSSGIELNKLAKGIEKAEDLIGKYVLHQKFTGIEAKRRDTGQKILLLEVTNIVMIVKNPDDWSFYQTV